MEKAFAFIIGIMIGSAILAFLYFAYYIVSTLVFMTCMLTLA